MFLTDLGYATGQFCKKHLGDRDEHLPGKHRFDEFFGILHRLGQSHLPCGLGIRTIRLGFSVQYFRFDELLTALRADAHLPPDRLEGRRYVFSALLLIDDTG